MENSVVAICGGVNSGNGATRGPMEWTKDRNQPRQCLDGQTQVQSDQYLFRRRGELTEPSRMMRTDGLDMQPHQPKTCISLLGLRHTWVRAYISSSRGPLQRRYQTHPKETQSDLRDGHAHQAPTFEQPITVAVPKVVLH